MRADALRDMLFVLLGLEARLLDAPGLASAFRGWDLAGDRSLVGTLVETGVLTTEGFAQLDRLVAAYLAKHGSPQWSELTTVGPDGRPGNVPTLPSDFGTAATSADLVGTMPASSIGEPASEAFTVGQPSSQGQRFRVTAWHAEGGLGVVYRAIDEELKREVALKQIKPKYADILARRSRFLLEAEITGGLEHPGVVPVYGLGLDEQGRPYYAMRFVRGESLKEACTAFHQNPELRGNPGLRSLELRKLLRRFIDVCNTIEYAHQRGVIHRDIKPDNIMVGQYGETLVLDWGIAKFRGGSDAGATDPSHPTLVVRSGAGATETLPGSALGTPAFMSPEQAAGRLEAVGAASDVYSLGATLYAILTGRPPFPPGELIPLLEQVKKGEFASPRSVDRSIPRALEKICARAMSVAPENRYASAQALADDVERWMADEPVTAYSEPFHERLRRWMRHHRTSVTTAFAVMLVGLVGLLVVFGIQSKANHELQLANQREHERFDLAMKAIGLFHTGVSEDFLLSQKEFDEQRKRLLEQARAFYRELEDLLQGATDRPSLEALARAYHQVGMLTSKIETAENALRFLNKSLDLREALAGSREARPQNQADLAESLEAVASVHFKMDRLDEAKKRLERSLAIRIQLDAAEPSSTEYQLALAWTYHHLAELLQRSGKTDDVLANFAKARAIRQALVDADSGGSQALADLAASDNATGRFLLKLEGRGDEAMKALNRARDLRRQLVKAHPEKNAYRDSLAQSDHNLANQLSKIGQFSEALDAFGEARDIREDLAKRFSSVAKFQTELAAVVSDMASRLFRIGRLPEALRAYERSRDIEKGLVDSNKAETHTLRNLALSHYAIGILLNELRRPGDALASFDRSRVLLEDLVAHATSDTDYRLQLAGLERETGQVLSENGRPDDALAAFELARAIYEKLRVQASDQALPKFGHARVLCDIGEQLARSGARARAGQLLERSRQILVGLTKTNPGNTDYLDGQARTEEQIALLKASTDDRAGALAAYEQSRSIRETMVASNGDDYEFKRSLALNGRVHGDLLETLGDHDGAARAYAEALRLTDELATANPAWEHLQSERATNQRRRAVALWHAGQPGEAAGALREALTILLVMNHSGAGDLAELATIRASLAGLAGTQGSGVSDQEARAEAEGAMTSLREAVAADYRDLVGVQTSPAFARLRSRPDFASLLADLAVPVDPFVKSPPAEVDAP